MPLLCATHRLNLLLLQITSVWIGTGTSAINTLSGTSGSAAHVAGLYALWQSQYGTFAGGVWHQDGVLSGIREYSSEHSGRANTNGLQRPAHRIFSQLGQFRFERGCHVVLVLYELKQNRKFFGYSTACHP